MEPATLLTRGPCVLPSGRGSRLLAPFAASRLPRRRIVPAICLLVLLHPAPAQPPAQPPTPASQSPATALATLTGTLTDSEGDTVAGARITLTLGNQPPPATTPEPRVATSADDGSFTLPNLPPGPFTLSIAAAGFASQQISGQLQPGETHALPAIVLGAASASTTVQVTATQAEIAEAQIHLEEKQRVLGVIPNFYVSYIPNPVPLTPRQKFELALKTMVNPVSFVLNGVAAGAEQATNTYAWGQGAQGYAKRYAAGYGTLLTSTLLGDAVLPILLKQDPRYFYKGTGSVHSRALYAIANAVICKGDNHHWQPNYSAILGSIAASGISNAYYPAPNRAGAGVTFEGAAIGTAYSAVSNLLQEFLVRKLTPHVPHTPPPTADPPTR